MYEELIVELRNMFKAYNGTGNGECKSAKTIQQAGDAIEELLKTAKAMHTWIFLNVGDEQDAYDECGLTDEMNAKLGYGGQAALELLKEEFNDNSSDLNYNINYNHTESLGVLENPEQLLESPKEG